MAEKDKKKPQKTLHALAFTGLVVGMFFAIFMNGLAMPFGLLVSIVSITLLALLIPVYDKILKGQTQSKFSTWAAWTTSFIVYGAALFLLLGLLQDFMGISCTGLFGTAQSCANVRLFELHITLLNPYVYLVLAGVILALLVRGRSAKPNPKR